jgi:serine protease Do
MPTDIPLRGRWSRRGMLAGGLAMAAMPSRLAAAADEPLSLPIALGPGRIEVGVLVDGHGPYLFILDSGGQPGLIDEGLARELHLASRGTMTFTIARQARRVPVYDTDLVVGGAFRQTRASLVGTDAITFGAGARGSLSAGFLTHGASALLFGESRWLLWPGALPAMPGYVRLRHAIRRLALRGGSDLLVAPASIGGVDIDLGYDTGAPLPMTLSPAAAKRAGLLDGRPDCPIGADARLYRAGPVRIAGIDLYQPLVSVHPVNFGSDLFANGLVGLGLLRLLDLATDPAAGDLLVRRNRLDPLPERYPRSGIWFERRGDGAAVAAVGRGSPAQAAGIAPGDMVVDLPFEQAVSRFRGPEGRTVTATIEREGVRRDVQVTLRSYLVDHPVPGP